MKGNGVIAKLLFLISVYEFPILLWYFLFNYYYYYKCDIVHIAAAGTVISGFHK